MSFLDTLGKLAEKASVLLAGPIVPAAVEIGKGVLELIQSSKEVVAETDVPKLEAMYDTLYPQVMAHADATENKLRG
jgi:hypothetical protein